ncbi:MAG: hypothetical protein IT530_04180 [Burkholderiales bacterium]|nr:hypothetical protein [Burkholderiales bacterium]
MSARELAVTILGLAATFFMPWPVAPNPNAPALERATLDAVASARSCHGSSAYALGAVHSPPAAR